MIFSFASAGSARMSMPATLSSVASTDESPAVGVAARAASASGSVRSHSASARDAASNAGADSKPIGVGDRAQVVQAEVVLVRGQHRPDGRQRPVGAVAIQIDVGELDRGVDRLGLGDEPRLQLGDALTPLGRQPQAPP